MLAYIFWLNPLMEFPLYVYKLMNLARQVREFLFQPNGRRRGDTQGGPAGRIWVLEMDTDHKKGIKKHCYIVKRLVTIYNYIYIITDIYIITYIYIYNYYTIYMFFFLGGGKFFFFFPRIIEGECYWWVFSWGESVTSPAWWNLGWTLEDPRGVAWWW